MFYKKLIACVLVVMLASSSVPVNASMTGKSTIKLSVGALLGALPGGIYTGKQIYAGTELNTNQKIMLGLITIIPALLGTYIAYRAFTPEAKIDNAKKYLESFDTELLDRVENVSTAEEYFTCLALLHTASLYPTIAELVKLAEERGMIVGHISALNTAKKKIPAYSELQDNIEQLLHDLGAYLVVLDKGISFIKSDRDFNAKYLGYQQNCNQESQTNLNKDLGFFCRMRGFADFVEAIVNIIHIFKPLVINVHNR